MSRRMNRQEFIGSSTAAALSLVPGEVLGRGGRPAPSERLQVGYVGCGTQGLRQMMEALPKQELRIAAICDPNR